MSERITVVIVDDIPETREHLAKLLGFELDVEVVGSAGSGLEALEVAAGRQPDVILLDINMPGIDGIATAEQLSTRAPTSAIIMMSVQGEPDYLRRAMLAGAREFLVKPFSADELAAAIRQVHSRERLKFGQMNVLPQPAHNGASPARPAERRQGKVITLFSPKGGVGRTTLAVNMAVAAALELHLRVVVVDGSLQFGDVGVLLNLNPKNKTIADVVRDAATGDAEVLESMLVEHSSGVHVLLAPPSPEMAELITADHMSTILNTLRTTHDMIVVDTWPWLHDTTLTILDQSDLVLALLTLEITNIKNMRQFIELVDTLGYATGKVRLVLNRADSSYGIRVPDVESSIGRKIDHSVVSDGRTVVYALNRGVPFVLGSRQAQVSQDVIRIARAAAATDVPEHGQARVPVPAAQRKSLFAWR
jgi:pilus assembly protein CpaE